MITDMGTALGNFIIVTGSFLTLLVLLRLFAWKAVIGIFQVRADKISKDIDEAEQEKLEAQALVRQRRLELDDVKKVADKILIEAKASAEAMRERMVADGEKQVAAMKDKANKDIAKQRQDALKQMRDDVSSMSLSLAQEIIMRELDPEAHRDLINKYLDKLGG